MSRYGSAIGIWEICIGRSEEMGPLVLKPIVNDHKDLMRLMSESKKKNDNAWFLDKCGDLMKSMIARDYPPRDDSERAELDEYVQFNLTELLQEMQIKFRIISREEVEKLKKNISSGMMKD